MASDCNNTTNVCQPCNSLVNDPCSAGCLDIYNTSCIQYDGPDLSCANITSGDYLNASLCNLNNVICSLQTTTGKIQVDINDSCPGSLFDKIVAGANVVLTGIGSGCTKQLRIDAVLGGQIVDELVKVSPTDSSSGYLTDKITFGPCVYATKVNPGLNEKLQISIDWQCVLNQLVSLPGYCTTVNSCITLTSPSTCPYITLNSPSITGSVATFTWLSNGINYNVYVDGVLQSNMPTGLLTFTTNSLNNGSHTFEVVALCNGGTPNKDTQVFTINTTCPAPNQLSAGILGGAASLTWSLTGNSNNQNQQVQYKLNGASTWTTAVILQPNSGSYTITGLNQNKIYNFQIVNNCSTGGPTPSTTVSAVELTCPTVNLTTTSTSVTYSFTNIAGDISSYVIGIYDSTGNTLIQSKTESAPFNPTVSNTFNGLNSNTSYVVKATVNAGVFSKVCSSQTITTPNTPSCPTPTNLSVTLS
jgi:hypothetical protein